MKFIRCLLLAALLGLQSALTLLSAAEAGRYLRAADYDVAKLIPPAPADDSLAALADLETVFQVQQRRTPEQVAVAAYFVKDSVYQYDAVLGPWFNAHNLPQSAEFFAQVQADRSAISGQGKQVWKRLRPPQHDPRIHACIKIPGNASYPSGHSTQAFVWANLLAEVFPEQRAALFERAQLVAWSRVVGGVHYPSDIVAGRMLGEKLAHDFLQHPDVREALQRLKAEAAPFLAPAAPAAN
jgi:acid phosphatase (class A)